MDQSLVVLFCKPLHLTELDLGRADGR